MVHTRRKYQQLNLQLCSLPYLYKKKTKPNKALIKVKKELKKRDYWVSASELRNYLLDDPLLDWLKLYGEQNGFVSDKDRPEYNPNFNFDKYIMNQGIKFENNLIQLIKQKFQSKFVEIKGYDPQQKYKKTIDALKKGIPIIYQGIVRNSSNKTFGYPDIIIRSDYINSLVCVPVLSDSEIIIPCNFHSNFHYLIVDIKFKMLGLTADGIHILKDQSSHVYKSQLLIYNQALGLMQGYTSNFAFILGRGNKIKGEVTPNCFDRLGKINFNDRDSIYFDINNNAISWIKDVKKMDILGKLLIMINHPESNYVQICPIDEIRLGIISKKKLLIKLKKLLYY